MLCLERHQEPELLVYLRSVNYYIGINMARETECEHNIDFYRIVGGDGLDVVEQCSECGAQIINQSPKSKLA